MTKIPCMNRSFVIVSSARSGSTLLVQLLNTNDEIVCKRELLNREVLMKEQLIGADRTTLTNFILASLLPWKIWLPYTGFKLFNEQLQYCNLPLEHVIEDLHFPPVIVLYRENLLETYVSLQIAFQNKLWYSDKKVNDCHVEVDWNDFYEYAERERKRWRRCMSALRGVRKIVVSYDQLAGDKRKETMQRLFVFLNATVDPDRPLVTHCVKQNPLQLKEKVINYQEIIKKAQELDYSIMINLDD